MVQGRAGAAARPNCRIYSAGRRRILQLSRCELTDTGSYTCDAGDCRASATLHVQERQVHIVQELQDVQVREGDQCSLHLRGVTWGCEGRVVFGMGRRSRFPAQ
ncbi:obscurin-like protein 1 [Geothlypis trichas]